MVAFTCNWAPETAALWRSLLALGAPAGHRKVWAIKRPPQTRWRCSTWCGFPTAQYSYLQAQVFERTTKWFTLCSTELFLLQERNLRLRFSSILTHIWINASLNPCLGWKDLLKEILPRSAAYHPCWCPSSRSWPSGGPLRFSAWRRRSLSEQTRWVWLLHSETPRGVTPSYRCICRLCPVWQAERGSAPRCWLSICSPGSGCSRCRRWCSRCTGAKTTDKRVIICSHAGVTGLCFSLERLK